MVKGETLKASDGYEVVLFPLEYLYMTQDEGGSYSHSGTYNIDLQGWSAEGRVYKCPYYAPCTLKCVNTTWDTNSHTIVWQSVDKVHLPNGKLDIFCISFAHDDNLLYSVGDVVNQGDLIGHTGTTGNVTGDHVHLCCGEGDYEGFTHRLPDISGTWDLTNRIHAWNGMYVNDTVIVKGYDHLWITYDGSTPTPTKKGGSFPWVLYESRFRRGVR